MKHRSAFIIGLAIFCVPLIIMASDKVVPFNGNGIWILDRLKSDLYAKQTANYDESVIVDISTEQSGPLIIEQSGDSICITNNTGGKTTIYNYKYGKKNEVVEIPVQGKTAEVHRETQTNWTKDKIAITETIPDHPEGEMIARKSFVLSKDAKKLTVKLETTLTKKEKLEVSMSGVLGGLSRSVNSPPPSPTGGESAATSIMRGINMRRAQDAGLPPHDWLGRVVRTVTSKQNQVFNKDEKARNAEK
jgi:hypothetical protein